MAEREAGVDADKRIVFRIGINMGDIIEDGEEIFGDGILKKSPNPAGWPYRLRYIAGCRENRRDLSESWSPKAKKHLGAGEGIRNRRVSGRDRQIRN